MSVIEVDGSNAGGHEWDLLCNARAGSNSSLGKLLQAYRDYLLTVADRDLGSDLRVKASASDVVQESFLEAKRDFNQFTGETTNEFQTWLHRVLQNNIANIARCYRRTGKRDLSREVAVSSDALGRPLVNNASDNFTASDAAMLSELLEAVQTATSKLPEHYQDVIRWRNYDRESFEVIGERLQRSAEAARKLWVRALDLLQQELESANVTFDVGTRESIQ